MLFITFHTGSGQFLQFVTGHLYTSVMNAVMCYAAVFTTVFCKHQTFVIIDCELVRMASKNVVAKMGLSILV